MNQYLKVLEIRPIRLFWLVAAVLFCAVKSAFALDPTLRISQYGHSAWRLQDGVFAGAPLSIAQTADGYLWIGTQSGLVRFDGVTLAPFVPPETVGPFSPQIESLLGASNGALWIGTGNGLFRLKDSSLVPIKSFKAEIEDIREDSKGNVWIARSRTSGVGGPLCQVVGTELRCYGKDNGIPMPVAHSLEFDASGDIWLASTTQLTHWSRNSSSFTYSVPGMQGDENLAGISALSVRPDGSLLVGVRFGGGLGLQTLVRDTWKPYTLPDFDGGAIPVSAILIDREASLWVGTRDRGIYRIADNKVDHFRTADGLSSNVVIGLYEDHEGDLWVATSNGIDRFRDVRVATISQNEGLSADAVSALIAAHDGTIWISNGSALDAIREDRVSTSAGSRLSGKQLTSLLEDHRGRLWVGIDNQLTVLSNGSFTPIKRRDGSPTGSVISITEDSDDNVWAYVIPLALLRIRDDMVEEEFPETKIPYAYSMAPDPRGGIWLGLTEGRLARYYQGHLEMIKFDLPAPTGVADVITMVDGSVVGGTTLGLVAWHEGTLRTLTVKNGLPCNRINSLIGDKQNNLWLYMPCGLVEVTRADLQAMWNRPDVTVHPRLFDAFDGVYGGHAAFQPTSSRSPDGRLWFANDNVVQVIDPAHLRANVLPPPVHIEQVVADHKAYAYRPDLGLPALTKELEIDYTALSLTIPEKMRFRYRLGGYDSAWVEPGTRRQAFYNDLSPGNYQFHVIAANNDGVWNETGASLNFTIAAAWYQTSSFKFACALFGTILVWSIYRTRVRQVAAAITTRFDDRMAERTRLAQELHDTLLQTILASKRITDDELEGASDEASLRSTLHRLSQWLGQAAQEGRAALHSLRVSLTLRNELVAAFQAAAEAYRFRQPMEVSAVVLGESREMHPVARDEVYRIGYEAIRNACFHSGGRRISIELTYAHDLTLRVWDNGAGMDGIVAALGKEGHFGLQGMRERAARIGGTLSIISAPTLGTEVRLWIPGKIVFLRRIENSRSLVGKIRDWLSRAIKPSSSAS